MPKPKLQPARPPRLMEVPLEKCLEPKDPARESIDPAGLEALAGSIKAVGGCVQPILVEEENGSYRIHGGHRRFLASRLAGMPTIRAVVYAAGTIDGVILTEHENRFREDLNPAEEARRFYRFLEQIPGQDVDQLCARLKLKRDYVEARLLLIEGDDDVFAALGRGDISMAVARELNKYQRDDLRWARLESAILGGATARVVREWRQQDEALAPYVNPEGAPAPAADSAEASPPAADPMTCCCCLSSEDKHMMRVVYVHEGVCRRLLEETGRRISGAGQGGEGRE